MNERKKKQRFGVIWGIVLGGIIGGLVFAFFATDPFTANNPGAGAGLFILASPFVLSLYLNYTGRGTVGAIIGSIVLGISLSSFLVIGPSTILPMNFIAIGILVGVLTGFFIGKSVAYNGNFIFENSEEEELLQSGINNILGENYDEGLPIIEKFAREGHAGAQYILGELYEDGKGVYQNWRKARHWYIKAARQGHDCAQNNLGTIHYNGHGLLLRDKIGAKYWHKKAAEQGNEIAERNLNRLDYGSGCYVATCVYGSYDAPEVWTLRRYRDNQLSTSWFGRCFIKTYYAISPTIVKLFGNQKWFTKLCKPILDKMVCTLQNRGM